MKEADGTTRIVEYTADKHHGFNAIVKKIGHANHPEVEHHGYDHHENQGYGHHGHHAAAYSYSSVHKH